jgi:uncharacterized GH25 family protein
MAATALPYPCRPRRSWLAICALLALLAQANPVRAHQKWLWPNVFRAEKTPAWVSFDVTWSDRAFTAEQGVGEQPLIVIDPQGERRTPPQVFVGKTKTTAEIELTKPGTYRLESVDPPTYWTRVAAEGGKERWLKRPKNEVQGERIIRSDLYYSKAVAYVTVGDPSELPASDDKDPLDIMPLSRPARLVAGDPLELRVVSYGKPVASANIKVFGPASTGHEPSQSLQCDASGVATTQCGEPGKYLFVCELERKAADDPKADIHSFNVYLTLNVQPKD